MSIDLGAASILEEKEGRKDEKSINGREDRCEMPSSLCAGLDKNAAYASYASRVEHARGILESGDVDWRNSYWIPQITGERK